MLRSVVVALLGGYAVAVIAVTVFPLTARSASWTMFHYVPFEVDASSFVLNVLMFVPYGLLVPLIWPVADRYRRLAGHAVAASAGIEAVQLILGLTLDSRRTVDVNDLIANTAGALLGLLVLRLAVPHREHRAVLSPPARAD
ncbi:MAG: VanZ family protein [Actinoplanes sp.]